MITTPTIFSLTADIAHYIVVIDRNFVSRASGKRKLYKSTLKRRQTVDPECCQKFASKEDEELMSQCHLLFSQRPDGWYINNFWFVKFFINKQLKKHDKSIRALQARMAENAINDPAIHHIGQ